MRVMAQLRQKWIRHEYRSDPAYNRDLHESLSTEFAEIPCRWFFMMKTTLEIKQALQNLDERISKAYRSLDDWIGSGEEEWLDPSWLVESCFLQLLSIAEAFGLPEFRKMIESEYLEVKRSDGGFSAWKTGGPDDRPYLVVLGRIRCYAYALGGMFPKEESTTVTKDVLQIVRYSLRNNW
jgi:hypothetical protein